MTRVVAKSEGDAKPYRSAVAVERAVDLLFIIADRGEATLGELARTIGSTGSAVHRILTALKNKGIVDQEAENGPYSLSWAILALTRPLSARADLRTVAVPFMRELCTISGETVTLSVRSNLQRVCIDQVEGPHEVRWSSEIGRLSPLYAGATGRAILAFTPHDEVQAYLRGVSLKRLTEYTIVSKKQLLEDIATVRHQGYALASQDHLLGVSGVSAPILDSNGRARAAMTIAGPSARLPIDRLLELVPHLVRVTRDVTEILASANVSETDGGSGP